MRHTGEEVNQNFFAAADAVFSDPDWPAPLLVDLFDIPLDDESEGEDVHIHAPSLFDFLDESQDNEYVLVGDEPDLRCHEVLSDSDSSDSDGDDCAVPSSSSDPDGGAEKCPACKSHTLSAGTPTLCSLHYMRLMARELCEYFCGFAYFAMFVF